MFYLSTSLVEGFFICKGLGFLEFSGTCLDLDLDLDLDLFVLDYYLALNGLGLFLST
jgi:hypothetical protein